MARAGGGVQSVRATKRHGHSHSHSHLHDHDEEHDQEHDLDLLGTENIGSSTSNPNINTNHSNFYDLPEPVANRLSYDEIDTSRARELNKLDSNDEDPGPIKKKFMPFFRKFWPHLDLEDKHAIGQKRRIFSQRLYGKAVEEVDPFVFEDVSSKNYFVFKLHKIISESANSKFPEHSSCRICKSQKFS